MKIAIIPRFAELLNDTLFEYDEYAPLQLYGVDRPGFVALRDYLKGNGHQIATIDRFELDEIDISLFVDMNYYYLYELVKQKNPPKLLYMMREPPTSEPFNSATSICSHLPLFNRVLTWNDDLAAEYDRITEYKLPYCHPETRYDERPSFTNRKLLINISSRKYSNHPNELYTARKHIVDYYEENHPEQFTLYGKGWNQRPSPMELYRGNLFTKQYDCYEGLVDDKLNAYLGHRFALCFENISNISGYVTEKIFDCFRAGTVPVYWGATDIAEYVPEAAFIDYREFLSPAELHKYLSSMPESDYETHLAAAQMFLGTDHRFTPSEFARQVGNALLSTPDTDNHVPAHLLTHIKEHSNRDRMMYDPTVVSRTEYIRRWSGLLRSNPRMLARYPQATYFGIRRVLPGKLGDIR